MSIFRVIALFVCLLPSLAFAARTTVADTIRTATGGTCSGSIYISYPSFYNSSGQLVAAGRVSTRVITGAFSVSLDPGAYYTANYQMVPVGCTPNSEFWNVPISLVPVPLSTVRSLNPPTPPTLIGLTSLGSGGATAGQCLVWNNFWGPASCGGGGGGGITSLNGQTGSTQTFVNDTNVTITSSGNIHTLGWQSTLAVSRGGIGVGTLTGIAKGNGTSAFTAALSSDVIGLFSGCSGVLVLSADGTCRSAIGTVTSVGWTGGLVSVANPTSTPAFTVAGTSGGVPYFSSASTWASSGALTANLPVIGGGAGAAPTVGTRSGNTTSFATTSGTLTSGNCAKFDANGNVVDHGTICASGTAVPAYSTAVVAQTSMSITAATHGQGTLAVAYCFDNSGTPVAVACYYTRDGSGNLVFTFSPAFTGTIEIGSGGGTTITGTGTVTQIDTTSPITGGPITSTGTIACATCGVTGSPLSQFASTTSAQLAGVLSNETGGAGVAVFNDTPTILTPTIASFTNATHDHSNAAGGGTLTSTGVATGSKEGDGTKFQMFTGADPAMDDCAKFDANKNLVSAGGACSAGGGGITALTGDVTASGTGSITATLANIPTAVPMAGYLAATAIAAPGTPAAGIGRLYVDSTSKNLSVKDDAGVVKHGVQTDTGTANNYISAISDAGAITKSRPTCSTLSDSAGGCTMSTTAAGDITGTLPTATVAKVNGIAYSATAAAHSVEVITTANTTATAKVIPDCTDAAGQHLNFTQSTDAFSCGTSGSGGANTALSNLSSVSINTSLLAQTGVDLGSTANPVRSIFLYGSGTYGSTYIQLTGTPTASRVLVFPNTSDTVAVLAASQTFTNKTLTAPVISTISNTGTLTLPTSTDTLVGRATTDTLTQKTFNTAGTGNVFQINGTGITAVEGNTAKVQLFSGSDPATNDCAKFDANKNLVTAGSACDSPVTLTTVTFSTTPTFVRSTQIQEWAITLTGNVTSSGLSGQTAADLFIFNICQDGTGGRTFAWPTGFSQAATISPVASSCTKQTFYWSGAAAIALTPGVTTATITVNPPVAFSTLPSCSSTIEGATHPVSDSSTNTWGATITGSSTNHVMAYCNGTNWTVMGK